MGEDAPSSTGKILKVILSQSKDPQLNLLTEKTTFFDVENGNSPETLYFWVNDECLVAGQIRSPKYGWYDEKLAEEMKIPVYRRLTGGGVVYHDKGNLNWSLFLKTNGRFRSPEKIFQQGSRFMIEALVHLGLRAYFAPPNRIEVDGKKVSGLAARSGLRCLLVHGTLLLNSNLKTLNSLCIPPPASPEVANLETWMPGITFQQVIDSVIFIMKKEGYFIIT
ncbi:MAG: biotin/lipoate A/B protein ligase family protein [Conexivisphaerales archaeon]